MARPKRYSKRSSQLLQSSSEDEDHGYNRSHQNTKEQISPNYNALQSELSFKLGKLYPVAENISLPATCQEPDCDKKFDHKRSLVHHLKHKHKYSSKRLPTYINDIKEPSTKFKCPGCSGTFTYIQGHYRACDLYQMLIKSHTKEEVQKENRVERYERRKMCQNIQENSQTDSEYTITNQEQTAKGPDVLNLLEEYLTRDPQASPRTRYLYMSRMREFLSWVEDNMHITSDQVLNFSEAEIHLLPKISEFFASKQIETGRAKFDSCEQKQSLAAYQYLCQVILHWLKSNREVIATEKGEHARIFYTSCVRKEKDFLTSDFGNEIPQGQSLIRLGLREDEMMTYLKLLQDLNNQDVNLYYNKLHNMDKLYQEKLITHRQIRDFILMMIIAHGNGNLRSLTEVTKKDWKERKHFKMRGKIGCEVYLKFQEKFSTGDQSRIVIRDERLENIIQLYKSCIRPNFIKNKDAKFLFVTSNGGKIYDLRNIIVIFAEFCKIPLEVAKREIVLEDFEEVLNSKYHILDSHQESNTNQNHKWKDVSISNMETFCLDIGRDTSSSSEQGDCDDPFTNLTEVKTQTCEQIDRHGRHVIPPDLRKKLFDMLKNLPNPPDTTLKDSHIKQASFAFHDWDDEFKVLKKSAVQAKEQKGTYFQTKEEEEKEARRILKASWRAMHRK